MTALATWPGWSSHPQKSCGTRHRVRKLTRSVGVGSCQHPLNKNLSVCSDKCPGSLGTQAGLRSREKLEGIHSVQAQRLQRMAGVELLLQSSLRQVPILQSV